MAMTGDPNRAQPPSQREVDALLSRVRSPAPGPDGLEDLAASAYVSRFHLTPNLPKLFFEALAGRVDIQVSN